MPAFDGIRRFLFGDRVGSRTSTPDAVRKKGVAGFRPEAGPFDEPPAEPVELDPAELPWELREGDAPAAGERPRT
ncbi:hypothetical protein BH11ACT3_BH11ACT3_09500 [soil metagenome]